MRRQVGVRGFTLLELTASMVVTAILLAGVAASFIGVQNVYQREGQAKSGVESGRVASAYLERTVRLLGYGIDPRFAIDIDATRLAGTTKSNYQVTATASLTGFITDDFAFRYRDPAYLRRGSYSGSAVTLNSTAGPGTFNMVLPAGRLLQIICPGGQVWAVVKTTAATTVGGTSVAAGSANVAANPTSFPPPPAQSCLAETSAAQAPFVMLIREVRLRVVPLGPSGAQRPYLVAYNYLDDAADVFGTTVTDFDPIAPDVEAFHVSYIMNRTTGTPVDGSGGDWVLGNDTADALKLPIVAGSRPLYDTSYTDAMRFNADVANVRAVQFDLSVRSTRSEKRKAFLQKQLADEASAVSAPDGFYHLPVSTSVRTPNQLSRTVFTPPLKVTGDPNPLNEWGG